VVLRRDRSISPATNFRLPTFRRRRPHTAGLRWTSTVRSCRSWNAGMGEWGRYMPIANDCAAEEILLWIHKGQVVTVW